MAYVPTEYTAKLVHGFATLLHQNGFGLLREDGLYQRGERGIYFDLLPPIPDTDPQESITITPYLPQRGILSTEHTSIQLRYRFVERSPLEIRDILDKVRQLFPEQPEGGQHEVGGLLFDRVYQSAATTWGEEHRIGVMNSTQNFRFRGNRYE